MNSVKHASTTADRMAAFSSLASQRMSHKTDMCFFNPDILFQEFLACGGLLRSFDKNSLFIRKLERRLQVWNRMGPLVSWGISLTGSLRRHIVPSDDMEWAVKKVDPMPREHRV